MEKQFTDGQFNPFAYFKTEESKLVGPELGQPTALAYGGGLNSTALLIGLHERGMRPDIILFADTGGEREETYRYVQTMRNWCASVGFPDIETVWRVTRDQKPKTLESLCLDKKMLPSLAYGFKKCSLKFKIQPQEKRLNHWAPAKTMWKAKGNILKYIGYDAGEVRRAKVLRSKDGKYVYQYPLISWGWGREECSAAIARAGLPLPGKSSCFYCPAMKKPEIRALPIHLKDRAVIMERLAQPNLKKTKGLGRYFSWEEFLTGVCDTGQDDLFDTPCDCYDGPA